MTGKAGAHAPWESLTAVREAMGMSKSELARKADMNLSHLGALESGRVSPRAKTIAQLAKALGVTPASIPPPGDMSWIDALVRERVEAELRRVGLAELAVEVPNVATDEEYNLRRVAGNMTQRGFLQEIVRIRQQESTIEGMTYVLSVLEDAVNYLKNTVGS